MTYDFKAWLNTKPDNEKYSFEDVRGGCAMGQFMASKGEQWDYPVYSQHVREEFNGDPTPLSSSRTFGELKKKVLELA